MNVRSRSTGIVLLAVAVLAMIVLSVAVGAAGLPLSRVVDTLLGNGTSSERAIVLDLRLPRALLGLLVGGSLALSGTVFQALLRNPLAEPYVLGVSGGAAVGAVSAIVLGVHQRAPALVPMAALVTALLSILLVLRIALQVGRALDSRILLLAGVIVAAFFNAIILLLLTLADVETFHSAVFWLMGSLTGASWQAGLLIAAYIIPAIVIVLALARPLNLLAAGEEIALHLGVRVTRVRTIAFVVASLLVAVSVAACGVIGFVGLIVPHALRIVWGGEHRFLLVASFLAGGAFLLLADTGARTLAAPTELPVGVITALVGVPLFVLLLRRRLA
ncbi:MAG: FecCD family ABC transporter permease [Longimicrobiales bacterium]